MKAIKITMYICGSLMIVAAVAGTIDYNVAQKNGSIKSLYKEEKPVVKNTHKEIDVEDYSRGEINRIEEPPAPKKSEKKMKKAIAATETYKEDAVAVKTVEEPAEETKPETPKKKKITYKRFSRGPIRDVEEDEVVAVADTAEKKSWNY